MDSFELRSRSHLVGSAIIDMFELLQIHHSKATYFSWSCHPLLYERNFEIHSVLTDQLNESLPQFDKIRLARSMLGLWVRVKVSVSFRVMFESGLILGTGFGLWFVFGTQSVRSPLSSPLRIHNAYITVHTVGYFFLGFTINSCYCWWNRMQTELRSFFGKTIMSIHVPKILKFRPFAQIA